MTIKNKFYQKTYNSRKSLDELGLNMRTGKARKEELKIRASYGASAILEIKITDIENAMTNKNKNIEIHRLTIPYLHSQNTLKKYLSKKEIKTFGLRYNNTIEKYWEIKNEK